MKGLEIRIMVHQNEPGSDPWYLSMGIDRHSLEGVVRQAAGLDGGAEWRATEHFVRAGVLEALLAYARKAIPATEQLRSERDLMYAMLRQPGQAQHFRHHEARLENNARRILNSERVNMTEAFADFVWRHFGGIVLRGGTLSGDLPAEVLECLQRRATFHREQVDNG